MSLVLSSPSFSEGGQIPRRYTCDGEDVSPEWMWSHVPEETKSFALLCSDPDAPGGTFWHWAVFDIPADARELQEGFPKTAERGGVKQAMTDFGRPGYGGPCPPPGHGNHRYHFRLLALSVANLNDVSPDSHCRDVEAAAEPHVLAEAQVTGVYGR